MVARRLQEEQLGSPETSRGPDFTDCIREFNISCSSLLEEREMEESCSSMERPLSYAAVAARADAAPAEADPLLETQGEAAPTAEERIEVEERMEVEERKEGAEEVLAFRPPPTPPPWSKFFQATTSVCYVPSVLLETEKSGMPNVQTAIEVRGRNSRRRENYSRGSSKILPAEGVPYVVQILVS